MQSLVFLRRAHIMQHRAGRNRRRRMLCQPKAFERAHIQLALDQRHGKLPRPDPILDARPRRNPLELRRQSGALGDEHFARSSFNNLVHRLLPGRGSGELRRAKLSGGNVQQGHRADQPGCCGRIPGFGRGWLWPRRERPCASGCQIVRGCRIRAGFSLRGWFFGVLGNPCSSEGYGLQPVHRRSRIGAGFSP